VSEVLSKVLARHFRPEINTGTVAEPVWVRVKGITNISFSPTKSDADTTDFDADGWTTHLVASRGASISLSGQRVEDGETGARDPGQEAIEELAYEVGHTSLKQFRLVRPNGATALQGLVSAESTPFGGGNDDPTTWECSLTFAGKPERDPAPAV
jgi:hypothetical protein